jgi:hypothetical protein
VVAPGRHRAERGRSGLGYKTVDDPSVTVRFRVDGADDTSFLGWTTTPWTLPSNCALAVRPSLDYVYAVKDGETFILAEARADAILGEGTYEIVRRAKGTDLIGMTYRPVFDYAQPEDGAPFRVIPADFVTADSVPASSTSPRPSARTTSRSARRPASASCSWSCPTGPSTRASPISPAASARKPTATSSATCAGATCSSKKRSTATTTPSAGAPTRIR